MRYDGRNPYGAQGGYVRDSRYGDFYSRGDREYRDRYDSRYDYAPRRMDYEPDMRYDMDYSDMRRDRHQYFPVEAMGRFTGYYGMNDRAREHYPRDGHSMMSEEELKHWSKKLMEEVDEKDKQFLKMENIVKKAEQMGIRFSEFSPYEFYVTVLMMFTDYHKTLGTANYDIYLKLAKDWLCDEDVAAQYGKKLTAYYENVVND